MINYNWRINNPYVFTQHDNEIIITGRALGKPWKDKHYKEVKDRIREHLRRQQNDRCAFCRLHVPSGQFYPHIEHIVPKGSREEFTFVSHNLAYSCQLCNFGKGQRSTLIDPVCVDYPMRGEEFNIVHPYFDDYPDHIDFIEELLIIPKNNSLKGRRTIEFYKLDRTKLALDRAFELNINNNAISIDKLTLRLTREDDPAIIETILALIDAF
ncbi:MAG: hypothetical protein PHP10_00455 [Candidatus Omnitrophica bacterium]|nr:hypothetical protein [Candidatus Omnitrophota bacterium]